MTQMAFYFEDEAFNLWTLANQEFACRPEELCRYMELERWDLVFNALCYQTGAVEEGSA